jgi:hypothetical protein
MNNSLDERSKIETLVKDPVSNTDYVQAVIQPKTPKRALTSENRHSISLPTLEANSGDQKLGNSRSSLIA